MQRGKDGHLTLNASNDFFASAGGAGRASEKRTSGGGVAVPAKAAEPVGVQNEQVWCVAGALCKAHNMS